VTLAVDSRLAHYGGPAENVSVTYRVTDTETGLVETTETVDIGTIEGDGERSVPVNLTVEREGGYRIETIVYEDDRRRLSRSTSVEGVGTLPPAYTRSDIVFERFEGASADLPSVEYRITAVEDNRTTLNVSTYLTNTGDEAAGDVRLVVTARQAESNIVADRAATDVADIRAGRTATPTLTLTVPDGYNYYLDAMLWKDGVLVGTARAPASLDPTETLSVNTTTREVGLEVGDFAEDEPDQPRATAAATTAASGGQPGFGVLVALVALGGGVLLTRRWSA
jgi:PGF-CTERM protein